MAEWNKKALELKGNVGPIVTDPGTDGTGDLLRSDDEIDYCSFGIRVLVLHPAGVPIRL